ncbi:hypothetical protein E7744_01875 [Citricoccus sp. SGAir0253]|uniref:GerMN domain-containing protein n=1 Tax=Citricoccus sp. SGAir0253 TaxID=2567881 RepID=UPI0010CCCAB8|nr:GerMN domain-containing protein [Citricoccus sp. SGAir0253]QCU77109.1 hypothetical protein E7744_01875 [Citricoccus sp. SGAir0253]
MDSPDDEVTAYWIALDGSGRPGVEFPGCGDLLFEDTVTVGDSSGPVGDEDRVEAGIDLLLATGRDVPGGFVNALYQSTLEVQDVSIAGDTVTVELTGQPVSGGTCDDPRIIAQLEHTAAANAGVGTARVLIDGTPIQEFLSPRG